MRILLVCQAGPGIGLGHFSRTLVISEGLRNELNADILMIIQGPPLSHPELDLCRHRFLQPDADLVSCLREISFTEHPDAVVLDLSPQFIPVNLEKLFINLRKNGIRVVGVDSLADFGASLDLLFIPSFNFEQKDAYTAETPVLWGWDCFLLRTNRTPSPWQPGKRVLILTGGSDARGLGETLPSQLDQELPERSEIHWVQGSYSKPPKLPDSPRLKFIVHKAPSRLDDLMHSSNYALTVYGVSFFELVYNGIPTVVFSPYDGKDDSNLEVVRREGIAGVAKDESDAVVKLEQLMSSDELAFRMSQLAAKRITGNGGQKLARAIGNLLN